MSDMGGRICLSVDCPTFEPRILYVDYIVRKDMRKNIVESSMFMKVQKGITGVNYGPW